MNVFLDIETIPGQAPGLLEQFAASITAPASYSTYHLTSKRIYLMQAMNEQDEHALSILYDAYLSDDGEVLTTSVIQLQYDAYMLGYQRAVINQSAAREALRKVMQNHVTALPLAIRAEIEAVIT